MNIPLSRRLLACCAYVHQNDFVADIGCDHGYLGIYLLKHGIASAVIESDINEMPLQCAKEHAAKFHVQENISFILSDGVQQLPHDFTCLVCAGMGADTIISILDAAPWLKSDRYHLVLQCQSKRPLLREYLASNGFSIFRETLVKDGRFIYTVMDVRCAPKDLPAPWEYFISPQLIADGSPLLLPFVKHVNHGIENTLLGLQRADPEKYEDMNRTFMHLKELERSLADDDRK